MADQKEIVLRQGSASPKDIVLYELPVVIASGGTTIYLYAGNVTAKDIVLRNPLVLDGYVAPTATFGQVKVAGSWKTVSAVYVNISGTWKAVSGIFTNISGVWKQIS